MTSSPVIHREDDVTVVEFGQDFESIGEDRIDAVANVLTQVVPDEGSGGRY